MIKTKILVTGLNGFIGTRIKDLYSKKYQLIGFDHTENKSVTYRRYTFDVLAKTKADIVLHLAAKTHIDQCEMDKKKRVKSESWDINVNGAKNIAAGCKKYNKFLLFLSTECVFNGEKSWYREIDKPDPINWYGYTKYNAEQAVIKSGCNYCILRSTLAYGHPRFYSSDLFHFFTEKFKNNQKVKAVNDQLLSLTFVDDLIKVITVLIDNHAGGIYHYAGDVSISPFGFAKLISEKLNKKNLIIPVTLAEFFKEKSKLRLKNATLSSAKIKKEFHLSPSNLHKAIKTILRRI